LFFSEEEARIETFRPYGLPTPEWLAHVRERMQPRPQAIAAAAAAAAVAGRSASAPAPETPAGNGQPGLETEAPEPMGSDGYPGNGASGVESERGETAET
jgi:hypothetical protein